MVDGRRGYVCTQDVGEVAFLKAEGVPRRLEEDVKAQDALISHKKPPPDKSERLNGMEERDEEDDEFWKNEEK